MRLPNILSNSDFKPTENNVLVAENQITKTVDLVATAIYASTASAAATSPIEVDKIKKRTAIDLEHDANKRSCRS